MTCKHWVWALCCMLEVLVIPDLGAILFFPYFCFRSIHTVIGRCMAIEKGAVMTAKERCAVMPI